jgi:hypothetical protein
MTNYEHIIAEQLYAELYNGADAFQMNVRNTGAGATPLSYVWSFDHNGKLYAGGYHIRETSLLGALKDAKKTLDRLGREVEAALIERVDGDAG